MRFSGRSGPLAGRPGLFTGGGSSGGSSGPPPPPLDPPVNTVAPAISGTPQVGQTLTSTTGTWTGAATITYARQWRRNGSAISGQTGTTYVVVSGDIGAAIDVLVTATNADGSASADSNDLTGAAAVFTPASISGLALWLDASDATTITHVGGSASQWRDKSGLANHASQATGTKQPITGTRTLNGLNVVDFDGSDDFMTLGVANLGGTRLFADATDEFTVFAVTDYDGLGGYPIAKRDGSNFQFGILRGSAGNAELIAVVRGTQVSQANGLSGTVRALQGVRWDGSAANLYLNLSAAVPLTVGGSSELPSETILIGARTSASPTFFLEGGAAEIVVYDRDLNDTEVGQIRTYLVNKWSVLSPPVNTVAPAISGTPQVGQTLTSTTGSWTGLPTITYAYQWRRDGSAISGATASTYVVVTGDIGAAIDCLVTATNGDGSASQDSNNLTGAAAGFDPASISGLVLWLDASDTSTITHVGGSVSQWSDKSGNGNHATQASGALQPQTGVNTLNGRNVVNFNSQYLEQLNIDCNDATFFIVGRATTLGSTVYDRPFIGHRRNVVRDQHFTVNARGLGIYDNTQYAVTVTGDTNWHLYQANAATALKQFFRDGTSLGSRVGTIVWNDIGIAIGKEMPVPTVTTNPLIGDIAEIAIYQRILSSDEKLELETYYKSKWGTP